MKTITKLSFVVLMLFSTTMLFGQALITDEEGTPDPINGNALLEIRTTNPNDPGALLIPKVNLQQSASEVLLPNMDNPTDGLIVYNIGGTDVNDVDKGLWYYDGDANRWVIFSNNTSVFSLDPGNFGELFEWEPLGSSEPYSIYNAYWTPWNTAMAPEQLGANFELFSGVAPTDPLYPTNGLNCTGLLVNSDGDGTYQVNVTATIEALSSGIDLIGALFVDGTIENKINFRFNYQTSNDVAALAAGGIIKLQEGQIVDLRFQSASATENIGIISLNMSLTKIGPY